MHSVYKSICFPLRRAALLLFLVAFQFTSSAHAACPSLLMIVNAAASAQVQLTLESCEVHAALGKPSMGEPLVLHLQAPALACWRVALAPDGPHGAALVGGTLIRRHNWSDLPEGPLLLADSEALAVVMRTLPGASPHLPRATDSGV